MTDGNAIEITAEDLTDFHRGIAVRDLGGLAFDEGGVATESRSRYAAILRQA